MKRRTGVAFFILIVLASALPVAAAKVCLEHKGMYMLIGSESVDAHLANGAVLAPANKCIDTCVNHNGRFMAVTLEGLKEHLEHGDTEVDPAQCLLK